jgi:hypothetical protein
MDWLSGWNAGWHETGDALRIGIDPETGTWGLPVDRALRTSGIVPPPLVIHHPNGMIETILDPSVMEWLVVRVERGRPVLHCASTPSLSAPAASGPPDR